MSHEQRGVHHDQSHVQAPTHHAKHHRSHHRPKKLTEQHELHQPSTSKVGDQEPVHHEGLGSALLPSPSPSAANFFIASQHLTPSVPPLRPIPGVPPGLECLHGVSRIFLKREVVEWPNDGHPNILNFNNRFSILNQVGHRIFFMAENKVQSTPISFRPFLIHFFDPRGNLVMTVEREENSDLSFWGADIAGNNISVALGTAEQLGRVEQEFGSWCRSNKGLFVVLDPQRNVIVRIQGSWTGTGMCGSTSGKYMDVNLALMDANGAGLVDPLFIKDPEQPEASPFGVQMPSGLDPRFKAILVGFLADIVSPPLFKATYITYYEGNQKTLTHVTYHQNNNVAGNYNNYGHATPHYEYAGRQGCTGWKCVSITLFFAGFTAAGLIFALIFLYFLGFFDT